MPTNYHWSPKVFHLPASLHNVQESTLTLTLVYEIGSLNMNKMLHRYCIVQAENSKPHFKLADVQCNESCWSFMEVEQHWRVWERVYQPHIQIHISFCSLPILFTIAVATFLSKLKGDFIYFQKEGEKPVNRKQKWTKSAVCLDWMFYSLIVA